MADQGPHLLQGSLRPAPIGLPYDIRAVGVPENGFHFRRVGVDPSVHRH